MKYLFESIEEQERIPILRVTWNKVKPEPDLTLPKHAYQKDYVDLPHMFWTYSRIDSEEKFKEWYSEFTRMYGTEGELVKTRPNLWSVKGNKKWDESYKKGAKGLSQYYHERRHGGYTGD